jgi:hypothetical protein
MRFIPHILRVKTDKLEKIINWKNRQQTFLKAIGNPANPMSATSWEITALEAKFPGFGSLRQNLMDISSKFKNEYALFLSVDTSFFRKNEVVFTFLPRHETEARTFVANLVPFFLHKYPGEIVCQLFHQDALNRAGQSIWNSDSQEVVTQADLYIEQSGDISDDFDLLEIIGIDSDKPTEEEIICWRGLNICGNTLHSR